MTLYEASGTLGIKYPTLTSWIRKGLIRPEGYLGVQGQEVSLSEKDLRECRVISRLREYVSLQAVRKVLEELRRRGDNPFSSGKFLVILNSRKKGQEVVKVYSRGEITGCLKKPQEMFLFPLGEELDV